MLRRLKQDVLPDLVPKKEVQVLCPLTELQRDIYNYIIDHNVAKLRGIVEEKVRCNFEWLHFVYTTIYCFRIKLL